MIRNKRFRAYVSLLLVFLFVGATNCCRCFFECGDSCISISSLFSDSSAEVDFGLRSDHPANNEADDCCPPNPLVVLTSEKTLPSLEITLSPLTVLATILIGQAELNEISNGLDFNSRGDPPGLTTKFISSLTSAPQAPPKS